MKSMDAKTLEYLAENEDIDLAASKLVQLLRHAKADREHGKTGLVCLLRNGSIVEYIRIREFTDRR